jgi:hypothetical protein
MRCVCPNCHDLVVQSKNPDGPNFCPHCQKLFTVPPPEPTPSWIFGVLLILVTHWQILLGL